MEELFIGIEDSEYDEYLADFKASAKDYPSVKKINFLEQQNLHLSKKLIESNFYSSIKDFSALDKVLVSLPVWVESEESKDILQDLSSPINASIITRVNFKDYENIFESELPSSLVFPLLESVTIHGFIGITLEYPFPRRNIVVPLLSMFSKSPLLNSVEITSQNLTGSEIAQYLTEGIMKLSSTIKN